jgi:hypothetical protein
MDIAWVIPFQLKQVDDQVHINNNDEYNMKVKLGIDKLQWCSKE